MDETAFRLGATHAADWLADVAKRMADEGKSARDVAQRLSDLRDVLVDWRTTEAKSARDIAQRLSDLKNVLVDWKTSEAQAIQAIELPEGESNPWEWTKERLDAFIAHRKKWFG